MDEQIGPVTNGPFVYTYLMKDIVRVESVQRRYTKRIPGLRDRTYSQRLRILRLDSLELRRLRADLLGVYKIVHGVNNLKFDEFFQFCSNNTRGHAFKLYPIRCNKSVRKAFFADRVVKAWNALKYDVVGALNIDIFKAPTILIFSMSIAVQKLIFTVQTSAFPVHNSGSSAKLLVKVVVPA